MSIINRGELGRLSRFDDTISIWPGCVDGNRLSGFASQTRVLFLFCCDANERASVNRDGRLGSGVDVALEILKKEWRVSQ